MAQTCLSACHHFGLGPPTLPHLPRPSSPSLCHRGNTFASGKPVLGPDGQDGVPIPQGQVEIKRTELRVSVESQKEWT